MKILRLYMLRDAYGYPVRDPNSPSGEPLYFNDKMRARAQRQGGQTLAYGPDHWKNKRSDGNNEHKGEN